MAQYGGFGGFGGFGGGTNITGLGSFLGAQDPGGYDPATTQGLQTTAEGLRHLTAGAMSATDKELPFSDSSNLSGLATWVRGSLYISEFLSGISAIAQPASGTNPAHVILAVDGQDCLTLERPTMDLLRQQCNLVNEYANLRAERSAEITSQLGFPTPYFAMVLGLHEAHHSKTFELITATQVAAAHTAMIAKHHLAIRRPDQLDARVMPMIPTPGHGSFPSAHATEAYAVLTVLEALIADWGTLADLPERLATLRGLAERIAVNRTVAGVHYPVDSWAGAALGTLVGQIVLNRAGKAIATTQRHLVATNVDFFDLDFRDDAMAVQAGLTNTGCDYTADASSAISWLYAHAVAENQGV